MDNNSLLRITILQMLQFSPLVTMQVPRNLKKVSTEVQDTILGFISCLKYLTGMTQYFWAKYFKPHCTGISRADAVREITILSQQFAFLGSFTF